MRDNDAEDRRGEYLKIFDEEYVMAIEKYREKIEKYKNYFPNYENVNLVREGYFALDKKKNEVEVDDWNSDKGESAVKAKSQEEIDRGIELILEKKDELISFNEPLAFIFSHSALREGWDNPNVFTLCTLKNGSSDIAKKQEIGRGLRLPVDVTGNRCLDRNVNELTVIANDSYENFSRMLQEDFNRNLNINEVTSDIILLTLEKSGIPKSKVTSELADNLKQELVNNKIMDNNNILLKDTEKIAEAIKEIKFSDEILEEHSSQIMENFVKYMVEKGTKRIEITNGDNEPIINKQRSFISEKEFKDIFEELGKNLSKKAIYKCKIDSDKYILSSIDKINKHISDFDLKKIVELTDSKGKYDNTGKFKLEKMINEDVELSDIVTEKKNDFEIANYIMYHTMLPRLAILKIIKGLEEKNRNALNIQDVLEDITEILMEELKNMKAEEVFEYEVIDGYETEREKIFEVDKINEEDLNNKRRLFKAKKDSTSLNEYYKLDSDGEKEFAEKLENNDNVLLFTKLKKGGFVIDTPYGNYSPDWAVVYRNSLENEENNVGIYFIVETKVGKEEKDLSDVEKRKIKCGKLHFEAISKNVEFDWVNSYDDFKRKFKVK